MTELGTTRLRLSYAAWFWILGLGAGALLLLPGLAGSEDPPEGREGNEKQLAERLANVERRLQQVVEALERLEKKVSGQGVTPSSPAGASPRYKGKALEEWMRDLGDRDSETAIHATQAVAAIGTVALPALRESLRNPDALVRKNAVEVVAMMGSGAGVQGIEALVERLEDEDLTVRRRAAAALGSRAWDLFTEKDGVLVSRDRPSTDALRKALPILIKALDEGSEIQETAARALGLFRWEAKEAVPALERLLGAPDEKLQWEAAVALGTIARDKAPEAAVGVLRRPLQQYEGRAGASGRAVTKRQRRAAGTFEVIDVLQGMGPVARAAIPELRELLYSPDGDVNFHSAIALARIDPENTSGVIPEVVSELVGRVESGSRRMQAIQALGDLGPLAKDAIPALEKVAQEPQTSLRPASKKEADGGRSPVSRLRTMLAAGPLPEEDFREAAAEALWRIRGK